MTVADDLLERIVADPDDHATRLVYGDALGGDRGEAITIAAELADAGIASVEDLVFSPSVGAGEPLERRALQLRRLRKLHADKGDTWTLSLGEDGLARDGVSGLQIEFQNGWASKVEVGKNTIDTFARFSQRSPITCVALRIFEQEPLAAFTKLPLQNVRELEINGPPTPLDWTALFAALPNLRILRWETLAEPDEVAAFADHPALRELELTNPSDANLAGLIGGACGRRLERLSLSGSYQSWDRRSSVFDDPLRVFTGVFPNAHTITINWLGLSDAHCLAARGLAFPRTTGLTSMNFTGRGLRALASGFGAVRDLDVAGAKLDDGALEVLVATAPQVERLRISTESITDAGIRSLAALRLKRLGLLDTSARPATLAGIVAEHDLEAYRIHAQTPLDTEFGSPSSASRALHRSARYTSRT